MLKYIYNHTKDLISVIPQPLQIHPKLIRHKNQTQITIYNKQV
jgi:hypothetical protein